MNRAAHGEHGSGKMASVLEVYADPDDPNRIFRILDPALHEHWPFQHDGTFILDVAIEVAPMRPPPARPTQNPKWKAETNAQKRNEHLKWVSDVATAEKIQKADKK